MAARDRTHYEVLGVPPTATASQIRSAWRKVVLDHHPDASSADESREIFLAAKDAYEALADPERRRRYDGFLQSRSAASRTAGPATPPSGTSASPRPSPRSEAAPSGSSEKKTSVAEELKQLSLVFARGQTAEAERIAHLVLARDARQAMPYAILGDIARGRGNLNEAQRLYAYAAQFDPTNPVYQRRYEELLADSSTVYTKRGETVQSAPRSLTGVFVTAGISIIGVVISAMVGGFAGVVMGAGGALSASCLVVAALAASGWLDRFAAIMTTGTGRMAPAGTVVAVMCIAYPLGVLLFGALALFQGTVHWSVVRFAVIAGVVGVGFALSSAISGSITLGVGLATLGSAAAIGGVLGWSIGDILRDARRQ